MNEQSKKWTLSPLGQVAQLVMGQSPESKYYSEEETGLPFLQGCADFQTRFPKHAVYCSQIKKVAPQNSILFSVRAPVGRINIADRSYIIGRGLAAIIGTGIEQNYLEHYLHFEGLSFRNASQGSTFEAINSRELCAWPIKYPTHKLEQSKIAEVLSTVDRAIEKTERLIAKQKRIKTGLMQDLLTRGIDERGNLRSEETHEFKDSPLGRIPVEWGVVPLSMVVDLKVGYAFKSTWFSSDGVRLLRGENVGIGTPDWKDTRCLPAGSAEKFREYELAPDDLIIGMDRTFTKQGFKVSQLSLSDVPCLLVQRVGCFIPKQVTHNYMKLIIFSPTYQQQLLLQQKGMDIPHLSKNEILSPWVPIPNESREMELLSKIYEESRTVESMYNMELMKLRSLKNALMQDLLTGQVRVTSLLEEQ
ncbi:restriction endonuclease subunit S [Desulfogranum marinum]|uniref:restriction endonuclease subunit S n=1 Tax=Desulfogranum marinum TaxID=453220 RepID=UPI0019652363|nr:restriction endonuclease subunit S [Desulfogranum marinum]MBM9514961.1 restriction endonuclease subunit S [Desulfogranum marinum]